MTSAAAKRDPALERVGRAVADRRVDLGLTQRTLAEKADVSLNTAALLERGETFPRAGNARKLEEALRWPRGALAEMRRGAPPPPNDYAPPPTLPSPTAIHPGAAAAAGGSAQVVAIAMGVVAVAAACMEILVSRGRSEPDAAHALRQLDEQLLALETVIAASLPQAESFDDTMSALTEVHRQRETIRTAAQTG